MSNPSRNTIPVSRELSTRQLRQLRLVNSQDGSNPLWGDAPATANQDCRILFQNVNGIGMHNEFSDVHSIGFTSEQLGINVLGLAETNTDWQAKDLRQGVHLRLRRYWKHTKIAFSSSDYRLDSAYQPGGMLIVVGQPWSGRASVSHEESGLGRWTEATLTGKDNRQVTIICVYRVVKNSISRSGPFTAFAQQWHLLRMKGHPNPDPHKQCLTDLGERIDLLVKDNHEIILLIDANESLQNPNSSFTKWVRARKLIDVHVQWHCNDDKPATYARGSKWIDYILSTQEMSKFVTAAGILPLHEFCVSDHRAVYADFAIKEFLRFEPNPLEAASGRALQSNDPRAVRKYRELLEKTLDESIIEHRVNRAMARLDEVGTCKETVSSIDYFDQEFTSMRLKCEALCTKMASYPWLPTLMKAKKTTEYWRLWVSELRLKRDFSIQRMKIRPNDIQKPSLETANKALRESQKELRLAIRNAQDLQRQHLRERAEMAHTLNNANVDNAIQRIARAEEMKATFARLRRILKGEHRGALSYIQVDDGNGNISNIQDQHEINDLLIERNLKHFSQADGTPFTSTPLTTLLGRYGTNRNCAQILDGKLDVDKIELTDAVKTLLRAIKRIAPAGSVDCHISADDIRRGYKRWRESTSTSPSGLHLGHEKALMRYESEDEEKPRLSDRVFSLKAKFLNIAIRHGVVYTRWKKIVNAMIEKIPGKPLINKLQVIHLIESDFNLMTGILWGRRVMIQGENLSDLGDEQGGSRKDRRAQEILLFKHMVYSVVRLTKTNCTSFDNDAKLCYDHIVMLFASLCSQRLGLDKHACELFLKVLDKAKYHVKTQLGISEEFYKTNDTRNIHEPGQGGRSSPSIWTIISCLLMKCMREKTDGASFCDPEKTISVNRVCSGFVDDITHLVNSFQKSLRDDESLQELATKTSITAQWWEELLLDRRQTRAAKVFLLSHLLGI